MSHPDVEDLDKVVLLLSNKQGEERLFIEVPAGNPRDLLFTRTLDSSTNP